MTGRVRGPRKGINGALVLPEFGDGGGGLADVQEEGLGAVSHDGREIIRVLFIPGQAEERGEVGRFIDDGGVDEGAQVEHAHGAIGADGGKEVLAAGEGWREGGEGAGEGGENGISKGDAFFPPSLPPSLPPVLTNIVHLLIVGNDLRLGLLRVHVPNRAGGVNAGSTQQGRVVLVPVEGGEGGAVFAILILWKDREGGREGGRGECESSFMRDIRGEAA